MRVPEVCHAMHTIAAAHALTESTMAGQEHARHTCICFAWALGGRLAAKSAISVTAAISVCASAGLCEAAASPAAWCSSCTSLSADLVILKRPAYT